MDIPSLDQLPQWTEVAKIVFFAAAVAFKWTEAAKWVLDKASFDDKVPRWVKMLTIRAIAVGLGIAAGGWLGDGSWGLALGFLAGAFNTSIIAFGKKFIKQKIEESTATVGDLLGGKGAKSVEGDDTLP